MYKLAAVYSVIDKALKILCIKAIFKLIFHDYYTWSGMIWQVTRTQNPGMVIPSHFHNCVTWRVQIIRLAPSLYSFFCKIEEIKELP